jgi:hypothetical protein
LGARAAWDDFKQGMNVSFAQFIGIHHWYIIGTSLVQFWAQFILIVGAAMNR